MSIEYNTIESLIGSEWRFFRSTNETVRLINVFKASSKASGKILEFEYVDIDKKPFLTNEHNFRRDFFWAERIK